jgi:hypothetical protein
MLLCVALVRTDVSEEVTVSFIRVTRIGELGVTLAVTSNRRTLLMSCSYFTDSCYSDEGGSKCSRNWVFISQKTTFFIVTAMKTSDFT